MFKIRLVAVVAVVAALTFGGCAEGGESPPTATVSATADLAPAFDAGVAVEAVTLTMTGPGTPVTFDLSVDSSAKSASGSASEVPLGNYSVLVSVRDSGGVVGQASGSVSVQADATIAVTIVIDGSGGGDTTGGAIEVDLE